MSTPTKPTVTLEQNAPGSPPNDIAPARPGSRADRMARPLARDVLTALAEKHNLCVNPIPIRRVDTATGAATIIEVPCGATLASKCKPCAERGRKLRQIQIREGWHQTAEPTVKTEVPSEDLKAAILLRCTWVHDRDEAMLESKWAQVAELDDAITELDGQLASMRVRGKLEHPAKEKKPRTTRSTRRRQDIPDLPRLKVEDRTTGKVYKTKDGKTFQPSTLLTVTLGSHGDVHGGTKVRRGRLEPCHCGKLHGRHDPQLGTPIDPATYRYRQAALDAIFFAAGLDRFWQNLRRAAGWKAQYAGTVELQKRLAPHAHFAMRGTLPTKLIKQIAAATYHQVWWPHFDEPGYTVSKPPVWSDEAQAYVDPKTGEPLQTWEQALKELDEPEATPAYTMRLGTIHATGITPGTKSAERNIRYITKYVTKDLTEQANPSSDEQKQHFDRLHQELQTLPCSPTCANWLLYGVQPKDAEPGLNPGRCSGKVHQRKTLGFTGRRVLISRNWSGKTLGDHRADQKDWIRNVLKGQTEEIADPRSGGTYLYELAKPSDPDVPSAQHRLMVAIEARRRWRTQIQQALPPPGAVPANGTGSELRNAGPP